MRTYRLGVLAAFVGAMGGCASTTVECSDLATGACKVTSTRLLTDSSVALTTPDNVHLDFSSKPDQAGTQAAINALAGVVTAIVPKPAAPPRPTAQLLAPVEPTADPRTEPGRWYEGPSGFRRYLESADQRVACWHSPQGTEHCATVREWTGWVVRPLPQVDTP